MTDQDPELRQLLAAARDGMSPTADDTERVRARLSSALTLPADPEPPTSPSLRARALRSTRLGWLALGLGLGGLAGYALGQRNPLQSGVAAPGAGLQVRQAAPPPGVPERTPAPPYPDRVAPPSAETRPQVSRPARPVKSDAGRADTTQDPAPHDPEVRGADEVPLMQRVNRALARGEAAWALALLRQLDLEVPQGRLLEERAAGGAIARCLLDPRVGAVELERYTQRYPSSVHWVRVSQVCTPPGPAELEPTKRPAP